MLIGTIAAPAESVVVDDGEVVAAGAGAGAGMGAGAAAGAVVAATAAPVSGDLLASETVHADASAESASEAETAEKRVIEVPL
jgi:hypothetical protein